MVDWDALVLGPLEQAFGEPVTFIPASGDRPFGGWGIFDEAYREVDIAGGQAVTTECPVLGIRISAFQSPMQAMPQQDDRLSIRGATYVIREVRLDSHGGAKLLLNVAP
jgi:hypothetical protein